MRKRELPSEQSQKVCPWLRVDTGQRGHCDNLPLRETILVPKSLEQIGFRVVFFSRQLIKLFASTSTPGTMNSMFLFLT